MIHERLLHPAEGSVFEVKGRARPSRARGRTLVLPDQEERFSHTEIEAWVRPRNLHVVAATVGEDEHSVGLQEILDIKHGGIERYGFRSHYLGTSPELSSPPSRMRSLKFSWKWRLSSLAALDRWRARIPVAA